MQHKLMKCFILFIKLLIIVSPFNKMPILAFKRDAVPDLFPLYASQIFKAILVYPFFAIEIFCVRYSRSYRKFFSEKVMTGADTWQILTCYSGLFIFFIYQLHYIIRDHTGNSFEKCHDPGQITYLTQKTEILLLKTKIKDRQKVFLNEHKNFK